VHRIAVIAGDGVGAEVVKESVKILRAVESFDPAIELSLEDLPWGTEFYIDCGQMMPPDALDILRGYDAIIFGAVGSPRVKDHVTLRQLLLKIRFGFDYYVNLRPIKLLPGIRSPLAGIQPSDVDMVFVREGTEGEYAGVGDRIYPHTDREVALQTSVFSRFGTERVIRWAFELAVREKRSVTSVSKGNALNYSSVLWDEVFDEVASEYPCVPTQRLLVDAAAMLMAMKPERFGVVVASNLFADILTDLGAAIMGGMGLAPSANLNPERVFPSMFEPVHGSAPDIAGKGVANPIGSIWSAAMMLEHLGHPASAVSVVHAIESVLQATDVRTPDLGGGSSTEEFGDAIAEALPEAFIGAKGAADVTADGHV
jgi:tartrate dehydrogenase/decarboxylase / D-malate dehydrogenase